MALALEEMGFTRYCSDSSIKPLLKNPAEPIDSLTMNTKSDDFNQAKYIIVSGDKSYSPNNDADIKYLNSADNKDGKKRYSI